MNKILVAYTLYSACLAGIVTIIGFPLDKIPIRKFCLARLKYCRKDQFHQFPWLKLEKCEVQEIKCTVSTHIQQRSQVHGGDVLFLPTLFWIVHELLYHDVIFRVVLNSKAYTVYYFWHADL